MNYHNEKQHNDVEMYKLPLCLITTKAFPFELNLQEDSYWSIIVLKPSCLKKKKKKQPHSKVFQAYDY